jgi:hypothetical protein
VSAREQRLAEVIGAVARQALADYACERIALPDDGSPEAALAARLLGAMLGEDRLVRVAADSAEVEPLLQTATAEPERVAAEVRRLKARLLADALPAGVENKTALLLGGALPPEPLLPLGDLYASEVAELTGGWSAPPAVRRLAELAGGVERLDEALRARFDERDPAGLERLPEAARAPVREALASGRVSRLYPRIVAKLGSRTLGIDLFE